MQTALRQSAVDAWMQSPMLILSRYPAYPGAATHKSIANRSKPLFLLFIVTAGPSHLGIFIQFISIIRLKGLSTRDLCRFVETVPKCHP